MSYLDYTGLSHFKDKITKRDILNAESIENTVQSYVFNQQGDLQQILHKHGDVAIRTDIFQFNTDNIVETRTLNSGESLTITTDLENMSTSIVYNEG